MAKNKKQIKKEFIENLEKVPIISVVCEKMNISRANIYRWFEEDPGFKALKDEALSNGRDGVNDLAESKLITKIQESDKWALRFWLGNNCSRYMKREKAETFKRKEPPIAMVQFIGDYTDTYDSFEEYSIGEKEHTKKQF